MSRTIAGPYIGALTRLVWQWVRQQIHAEVVAAGYDDLNPAHVGIFRNPSVDGRRPSELADEMQITKQSVNELLGHLERRGYLVRERDPSDSRGRRIRLTDRGRTVEDVVVDTASQAERTAAELIGEDRLHELRRTLTDLVSRLDLWSEVTAASGNGSTSDDAARSEAGAKGQGPSPA